MTCIKFGMLEPLRFVLKLFSRPFYLSKTLFTITFVACVHTMSVLCYGTGYYMHGVFD